MSKLRSYIRRPSPSIVVALLALVVAASGAAFAAIPQADGTIDACYNTTNGGIRVIDAQAGETCSNREEEITLVGPGGHAATADDSDLLDGMDSTEFLGANATADDSDLLDGMDSTEFLGANAKADDSDLLDGMDSTDFLTRFVAIETRLTNLGSAPAVGDTDRVASTRLTGLTIGTFSDSPGLASVAAQGVGTFVVNVPGIRENDLFTVTPPTSLPSGVFVIRSDVTANDQVSVTVYNSTQTATEALSFDNWKIRWLDLTI